eukprot:TRINITY_DN34215_c0_g1_i2.p1 TRINITY_DN34215_c0_g1~~TRINITY_DN34215_c0_g1_i2.p1  ORF type:complete len:466 (+),score=81.24 TRINITY_DN34215_c0_g1_i2:76-1473(+)
MAKVTILEDSDALAVIDSKALLGERPPAAVDPATGCPSELRRLVCSQDPHMTVVPNFLTDVECKHLRDLAHGLWTRSLVGSLKGAEGHNKPKVQEAETRTSCSAKLRYAQTEVLARIETRLAQLAGLPVETLERLVMVRYQPGETFKVHHDGKFRPRTIFVYLNDLPEDDDGGDTFFPHLGLSFRPRCGTAAMWSNATPEGSEDSRMVHAGRPPKSSVKYGVNCFFNVDIFRILQRPQASLTLEQSTLIDLHSLGGEYSDASKVHTYKLDSEPQIVAVPRFATAEEAAHLGDLAEDSAVNADDNFFKDGTVLLRVLQPAETALVGALEERLSAVTCFELAHIGWLRLVRSGSRQGLSNRGCGQRSGLICLAEEDEVFYPHLGLRLLLRKGDMLTWPNAWFMTEVDTACGRCDRVVEDMRGSRMHVRGGALCADVSFHDFAIREQQLKIPQQIEPELQAAWSPAKA